MTVNVAELARSPKTEGIFAARPTSYARADSSPDLNQRNGRR